MMQVKLSQIAMKAKQDKRLKFTSLMHQINESNLTECYHEHKRNKACGIDGETVESYGQNLETKLQELVAKLKSKQYRPQPVRRVYIPKPGKAEKRDLGMPINYIVEVDIRKFFDKVNHYWLQRCLEERIADRNIMWLVRRFLKAGIMEEGKFIFSPVGTPQGGVTSPLLTNIYLHYVLDLWFEKQFKPKSKGYIELIRYCDDFVVYCESEHDAEYFLESLKNRLNKFGLEVAEDKTKVLKFGRRVWQLAQKRKEKVESFNFLGFTHYCTKSRRGKFIMGHKTSKENLSGKLKETKVWLKKIRNQYCLKDWWPTLKAKLTGHYNYFGISGNMRCLKQFYQSIFWMLFKWINRRSQKKSMTIAQFQKYLEYNPLPIPRICYALYSF